MLFIGSHRRDATGGTVPPGTAPPPAASSAARLARTRRMILPVAVLGSSSRNSSACGRLYAASRARQWSMSSEAVGGGAEGASETYLGRGEKAVTRR